MALASVTLAALLAVNLVAPAPSDTSGDHVDRQDSETVKDRVAAKQAFDEGLAAVASGEYEAAVAAFEHAHALLPHPVTLFNLALALEKAERLPEAWGLFNGIIDVVQSNAERREIRRHMRAIEDEVAIVEIDARPQARLCIDGLDVPAGETSDYRLAITAGRHELLLDEHALELEFEAGDRRVLLLGDTEDFVAGRRRSRLMPGMIGAGIGLGGLAIGLGVGAAVATDEGLQVGLAAGAAGSAGLAVIVGIVALLVETRAIEDPTTARVDPGERCPGAPTLEQRLDLRLAPSIDLPIEFSDLRPLEPPIPSEALVSLPPPKSTLARETAFPHPHGLAPPRPSSPARL